MRRRVATGHVPNDPSHHQAWRSPHPFRPRAALQPVAFERRGLPAAGFQAAQAPVPTQVPARIATRTQKAHRPHRIAQSAVRRITPTRDTRQPVHHRRKRAGFRAQPNRRQASLAGDLRAGERVHGSPPPEVGAVVAWQERSRSWSVLQLSFTCMTLRSIPGPQTPRAPMRVADFRGSSEFP